MAAVARIVSSGEEEQTNRCAVPQTRGCLDGMQIIPGFLRLRGWLLADDGYPLRVSFTDHERGVETQQQDRPDVAAAYPGIQGARRSGWQVELPADPFLHSDGSWQVTMDGRRGGRVVFRVRIVTGPGWSASSLPLMLKPGEVHQV